VAVGDGVEGAWEDDAVGIHGGSVTGKARRHEGTESGRQEGGKRPEQRAIWERGPRTRADVAGVQRWRLRERPRRYSRPGMGLPRGL
jgi:hypothetical protein